MTIIDRFRKGWFTPSEQTNNRPVMSLAEAPIQTPLRLHAVHNGRKLTRRLAELGLTIGTELTIIQKSNGPLLVSVRGSRIALGRGLALKIEVKPLSISDL